MPFERISIAALEMMNFKRFAGSHRLELDAKPEEGKPLVLIGGDNGRGKTTIQEAISYALYEDDDLPGIQTRPSYLKAVGERLNRSALDRGERDYWVAVDLHARMNGVDRNIRIERRWDVDPARRIATQSLAEVSENGRPVDFLEANPAAYQDFLRSLIPPRIAPFFFFDGERIQEFADDQDHARRMVEAVEDILHISVYKSLRDDLKKFVVDHVDRDAVRAGPGDDLHELEQDRERIEDAITRNKDRIADIERSLEDSRKRHRSTEDELRRIASPHESDRDDLAGERARLTREVDEAKAELQSCCEKLPLLLAGELRRRLLARLQDEQRVAMTPEKVLRLRNQISQVRSEVFLPPSDPPATTLRLSDQQFTYYTGRFDQVTARVFDLDTLGDAPVLHDIGEGARARLIAVLAESSAGAVALRALLDRRERLSNELRTVETKLQATSDDPHVGELLEELKRINQEIGGLEQEKKQSEGTIQKLQADYATRIRQIESRLAARAESERSRRIKRLAEDTRLVLDDFIHRLAPAKLNLLRDHMAEMYERLRKPEDPVREIAIDPETWRVDLRDSQGRSLERRVFSAGMKEMYALALLWALARASGRELPIIIDTPAGRLDTTNRRSLFEQYLPYAGHQVIVLSTDTEVDIQWAERLAPYVARQYRLDYDNQLDSVVVRPGYFC